VRRPAAITRYQVDVEALVHSASDGLPRVEARGTTSTELEATDRGLGETDLLSDIPLAQPGRVPSAAHLTPEDPSSIVFMDHGGIVGVSPSPVRIRPSPADRRGLPYRRPESSTRRMGVVRIASSAR
jgi:hypothetical protein